MGKGLTLEGFIKKAKEKHGNKFDYSLVEFSNCKDRVKIICPFHGEFTQQAESHYKGAGCMKCWREKPKTRTSVEDFIKKSRETHGNKYDYSKVSFSSVTDKVTIICPKHGEFQQQAWLHQNHHGCARCGQQERTTGRYNQLDNEGFIERARKVHGDRYDYSESEYTISKSPLKVICPDHGPFWLTPSNHLAGSGCQTCNQMKRKISNNLVRDKNVPANVYLVRAYSPYDGETFVKVGFTRRPVDRRFKGIDSDYHWQIINSLSSDLTRILDIEEAVLNMFLDRKYIPSTNFCGQTECLLLSCEEEVDEFLELIKESLNETNVAQVNRSY